MDPYIGKFLDDRYEILDVLGTGGMAVVYRAYCHRLNRYVAVKILKGELASDQDLRRRFHDESQAVAMLSHQNIVSIYDVNQIDECEYIVMELIDGITLKQYMHKRGGCLNWREALHFATQILQALKHAHSRGIIHRDIKPQNVMVLRDGSVKVTDFGIARSTTSQATVTQEAIGSVHYISPEQARGSHIDARSDLYSCGVVLYEMLTGRLPYEGDNPVSVAIQHINSIPIAPRELNSAVPVGMEQITMKAMASAVDRRYVNAEQMLQDLEDFRRNPDIDFGYIAPGIILPDEDEPTMIRKGAGGFAAGADPEEVDAVIREAAPRRSAPARFEREAAPAVKEDDYDEEEDEDKRKNRLFIGVTAGIAGVLVIVFIILWFTLFKGLFAKAETYTVPSLLGSTVEEAEDKIAQDTELSGHFTITIDSYEASEDYEAGQIMGQTPNGGRTTTEETTEIKVTVSTGPEVVQTEDITLEDYAGSDYRAVMNALRVLGLDAVPEGEYNDDIAQGMVIRTDPEAGTTLLPGDTVTIYYSLGTESFSLEDYTGQDYREVKTALEELGLRPIFEFEFSETIEQDMVTRTEPVAGSSVKPDDTITVYYSVGPEEKTVEMTSLLGLTEEDARNAIAAMNLTIASITSEYNSDYAAGKVCYQSIPDRTVVPQGSPVTLVISLGPEPEVVEPTVLKTIVVYLDPARTESCTVEIVINGAVQTKTTVPVGTDTVEVDYEGQINSYSITVNGEAYDDFDIIDN